MTKENFGDLTFSLQYLLCVYTLQEHIEATLANTVKEVGLSNDDQPLYIDLEDNLVKCKWCGKNFAGSNQVRCINQHVRKSVSHRRARQQHLPSGTVCVVYCVFVCVMYCSVV